jgi:hypothetical protein
MSEEQYRRFLSSGAYLWDHMGEAPILLLPCCEIARPPRGATSRDLRWHVAPLLTPTITLSHSNLTFG